MTSRSVLAPCVKFGYNCLNSCWSCDEKHLLSCCAARDTHFSAFISAVINSQQVDWLLFSGYNNI